MRHYHTVHIQAGEHTIAAEEPLPDDVQQALTPIRGAARGHPNVVSQALRNTSSETAQFPQRVTRMETLHHP